MAEWKKITLNAKEIEAALYAAAMKKAGYENALADDPVLKMDKQTFVPTFTVELKETES